MNRFLISLLFIVTLQAITSARLIVVGEYIAAFSVKDDTLFYATQRGDVFKSIDTGASYQHYCSFPADFNVSALLLLGNTILYGTNNSGIYASTDSGTTWSPRYSGIPDSCITSLAALGGIIYAGTNTEGVFMSADTGATWKAVNNELTNKSIQSITMQNNTILASAKDIMDSGLFISADSGGHWEVLSKSFPAAQIACYDTTIFLRHNNSPHGLASFNNSFTIKHVIDIPLYRDTLFIDVAPAISAFTTCCNKMIIGTCDRGVSRCDLPTLFDLLNNFPPPQTTESVWSNYSDSPDLVRSLFSLTLCNNRLYAGTERGIIMSLDNGTHWTKISDSIIPNNITSIAVRDSVIIACNNNSIYRSLNRGKTWTLLNSDPSTIKPASVVFFDNNLFLAADGRLIYSTNFGDSWALSDSGLGSANITVLTVNPSFIYASGDSGIFQSADTGKSWKKINKGSENISKLIINDSNMIVLKDRNIYWFDSHDNIWKLLTKVQAQLIELIETKLLYFNEGFDYTYIEDPFAPDWVRSDGIPWGYLGQGGTSNQIFDFTIVNGAIYAATEYGIYQKNTYNQDDWVQSNLTSWTKVNNKGLPSDFQSDIQSLTTHKTVIYAASRSQGVFFWNSSDTMWDPNNEGLTDLSISDIISSGDNILAATPDGVFYSNTCCGPWSRSTGIPESTGITLLASCGNIAVATSTNDAYRSVNNGMSWEPLSKFIDPKYTIKSLAILDTVIFVYASGIVFRSTDNGQRWEKSSLLLNRCLLAVDSILLAGGDTTIYISRNYGESWATSIQFHQYGFDVPNDHSTSMVVHKGYLYVGHAYTGVHRINLQDFLPVKNPLVVKNSLTTDIRVLNHISKNIIFSLTIPHDDLVRLSVYDVRGRLIASPVNTRLPAGKHRISWSARTNARGFYILKMQAGKKQIVRKFQMF